MEELILSDIDLGWVAGLFEGEGCIYLSKKGEGRHAYAHLALSSTDFDVLQRLRSLIGGEFYEKRNLPSHHKRCWQWRLAKQAEVERVLILLYPQLGARRSAKVVEWFSSPDRKKIDYSEASRQAWRTRRERYGERGVADTTVRRRRGPVTHCKHGHEFTPENTYIRPDTGNRQCISCNIERARTGYLSRKAARTRSAEESAA